GDTRAALPFALDAVRIHGPTTARMTVRVRRAPTDGPLRKFDLDLADEDGRVRVSLRGFASMPAKAAATTSAATEPVLSLLAPVWQRIPDHAPTPIDADGGTLVVGACAEQFAEIAQAHADAIDVQPAVFDTEEGARAIAAAGDRAGGRIGC